MLLAQHYRLTIDGCDAHLRVMEVRGVERIHAPFSFEVRCAPADERGARVDLAIEDLFTHKATLAFDLSDDAERVIEGLVDAVDALGAGLWLRIVPRVALLGDAVDHQVFVDEDALAIVEKVLSEHSITVDKRVQRKPAKRAQCVQVFETDLAFVSRLLAEEGIAFYLSFDTRDKLVLTDRPSGFDDAPGGGAITACDGAGMTARESIWGARLRKRNVPDKVTFRDYDFEKPLLDMTASADAGTTARERYEYPGRYTDPSLGKELAKLRLDQLRARAVVLTGETSSRRLSPGHVITIADAGRGRINGRFLILEVEHEGTDQTASSGAEKDHYVARFTAVPAESGYRPERPETPRYGGVQTATVTGPGGAEIHTEGAGRVKVLHRWDRRRPKDDTSSMWVRVVQPPMSGSFLLPRMGWEALVGFSARSADVPIALGRLYNGQATPPSSLPGKKVVSSFGTQTTPGGGSANVVSMDDTAGNERMSFGASKDFNERTENDKNTEITASDTWTVGANRDVIVGQVLNQTVGGAQSYSVGGSREVNVTSNKMVNAASESVLIGGLRMLNIGGDLVTGCGSLTRLVGAAKAELGIEHVTRAVKGPSMALVAASWKTLAGASNSTNVLGASTELVGGAKSIKGSKYTLAVKGAYSETLASRTESTGGDRSEEFGAAVSYTIGGSAKIDGSEIVVKATASLTIKAGGVTISMTPGSVEVSGDFKGSVDCVESGHVNYE
jgi:type VI secretion system secreted protein VgrG